MSQKSIPKLAPCGLACAKHSVSMNLCSVEHFPRLWCHLVGTGIVRWEWFDVGGTQGRLEEVLEFIHRNHSCSSRPWEGFGSVQWTLSDTQ